MMSEKLQAGAAFPVMQVARAGGGAVTLGERGSWQLIVVYRGKHCPICRTYLKTLNALAEEFQAIGTQVLAVSADPKERVEEEAHAEGWRFPVGFDLSLEQMRRLGLYVSEPRSSQETDRPFAEPGLFVVNPEGKLQIVDVSNAPFARPDLKGLLDGLRFVREKNYPIRGTYA